MAQQPWTLFSNTTETQFGLICIGEIKHVCLNCTWHYLGTAISGSQPFISSNIRRVGWSQHPETRKWLPRSTVHDATPLTVTVQPGPKSVTDLGNTTWKLPALTTLLLTTNKRSERLHFATKHERHHLELEVMLLITLFSVFQTFVAVKKCNLLWLYFMFWIQALLAYSCTMYHFLFCSQHGCYCQPLLTCKMDTKMFAFAICSCVQWKVWTSR